MEHTLPAVLLTTYNTLVDEQKITSDDAQRAALLQLERLITPLTRYTPRHQRHGWEKLLPRKQHTTPRSIYIYGEVGRGKSMVMDLFFAHCPVKKKRRVHFHAFMQEIHALLHEHRQKHKDNPNARDPIPPLARLLARDAWLLCFDEFHVTDIADAMLLGRLFTELFSHGVVVVATSNRHPDDLYKDGLQRARFIPFITLLKNNSDIIELRAAKDYRLDRLKTLSTTYFTPLGKAADQFIETSFTQFSSGLPVVSTTLTIQGRKLLLSHTAGDTLCTNFAELCERPLGAADYIAIAEHFRTVILRNIPQLTPNTCNEAKRFVTLIDVLYEHKTTLICSAAVPPEQLYIKGTGAFEFERTVSRLLEMQSSDYFSLSVAG